MIDKINGGVYAVDLGGTEAYEFKGVHPAMIVRTLKEPKMYVVVPLTTYTQERWEKCKRKGFGIRIKSTNSIARVDKLHIVSENQIRQRYYNADKILIPTEEEVVAVFKRVEEYILLSDKKALKEYKKYLSQKSDFENAMDELLSLKQLANYPYGVTVAESVEFKYPLEKMSCMNTKEIKEIICNRVQNLEILITKQAPELKVEIKLNPSVLLTFKEEYDRFNVQKGVSYV